MPAPHRFARRLPAALVAAALVLTGLAMPTAVAAPASGESDFTTQHEVSFDSAPRVGQEVTVRIDKEAVPQPLHYSYQWYLAGTPVHGGINQNSYTPTEGAAGYYLWVRVTAELPGYSSTSADTERIMIGPAQRVPVPEFDVTITGDPRVGAELEADYEVSTAHPHTAHVTWLRNGANVVGSGKTYTVAGEDLAQQLTAQVRVSGALLETRTVTSAPATITGYGIFTTHHQVSIDGDVRVGSTLTANIAGSVPEADDYAIQWFRDGTEISGADESTYTLSAADLRTEIGVEVTAVKDGYTPVTATATRGLVGEGFFSPSPQIELTGDLVVGQLLTVSVVSDPQPTPDYEYSWIRNGAPIPGADSSTYLLTAADEGARIAASVTATRAGYITYKATYVPGPVAPGTFTALPVVELPGTARVGDLLEVEPTGADPEPDGYTYRWLRSGTPIVGATGASYTVTTADYGAELTVEATAVRAGYTSVTVTSTTSTVEQRPAPPQFAPGPVVDITGTPRVGETLTAELATSAVPAPDSYGYQWSRDGEPIVGATDATYDVTVADHGAELRVTVTAHKAGYVPATTTDTVTIGSGVFTTPGVITIQDTGGGAGDGTVVVSPRVGRELTAVITQAPVPSPGATSIQWLRDGEPIPEATEDTYTPTADDEGTRLSVRLTAVREAYETTETVSEETKAVLPALAPQVAFNAGRTKAPTGTRVRLTWDVTGADTVQVLGPKGRILARQSAGTLRVTARTPRRATYTLIADGLGGRITERVTITYRRPAKKLRVIVNTRQVTQGTVLRVRAIGLAARERFIIRLAGRQITKGRANHHGIVNRRITVHTRPGTRLLRVRGIHQGRTGTVTIRVLGAATAR